MKVEDYLALDYPVGFVYHDGEYIVQVVGCKGCFTTGDTFEQACWMIVDAFKLWLEVELEDGDTIPEPAFKPIWWEDYTALVLLPFVRRIAEVYEQREKWWRRITNKMIRACERR